MVHDERVAIIAIQSVVGGKPHEAAAILDNRVDSILGQAIVACEAGDFGAPRCMAAPSVDILKAAGSPAVEAKLACSSGVRRDVVWVI